ncbi:MAG: DUF1838 family protein [Gammaproteobacteria bacterium]|nr:DUF1838 family protein [Gammaproteobacteria bacterium]
MSTRRQVLKGLALTSFGLAGYSPARAADSMAAGGLDLGTPASLMRALVRMRGSLDERIAYIWLRGIRYTLVDGEALPMCAYLGGSITRYRRLSDEMYEFLIYEISYYTDIESGEILETLRMPYTDREVSVPLYRSGPGRHVIMMANDEELEWSRESTTSEELARQIAPDAKIFYSFRVRPSQAFGGNVWIRSDSFTRVAPYDPGEKTMFYKEAITYRAREADLAEPDAPQVDATISFAIATAWRPWMEMEGVDGHTVADGFGGKVFDIGEMPEDFVRFTAAHHPDVLKDPDALLKS